MRRLMRAGAGAEHPVPALGGCNRHDTVTSAQNLSGVVLHSRADCVCFFRYFLFFFSFFFLFLGFLGRHRTALSSFRTGRLELWSGGDSPHS